MAFMIKIYLCIKIPCSRIYLHENVLGGIFITFIFPFLPEA